MPYAHAMTVYDGTPAADDVLDMVCRIVRPHRAQLTILHVKLVPLKEPLPRYEPGKDAETDDLVARAERLADSRGVKAASAVRYARALGAVVVSEARVRGVDLLALLAPDVVDRTPAGRCISPDLETVLRRATCAVMLCRPSREGELGSER
ncbi:MAG TPA: universal stress protein [Armatimonadota bacterium]|nr:universal stress protein [Armatimonadota bacterium]